MANNQEAFAELAGPTGRLFIRPSLIEQAPWELDMQAVAAVDQRLHEAECAARVPIGQIVLAADSKIGRAFTAAHAVPAGDSP